MTPHRKKSTPGQPRRRALAEAKTPLRPIRAESPIPACKSCRGGPTSSYSYTVMSQRLLFSTAYLSCQASCFSNMSPYCKPHKPAIIMRPSGRNILNRQEWTAGFHIDITLTSVPCLSIEYNAAPKGPGLNSGELVRTSLSGHKK